MCPVGRNQVPSLAFPAHLLRGRLSRLWTSPALRAGLSPNLPALITSGEGSELLWAACQWGPRACPECPPQSRCPSLTPLTAQTPTYTLPGGFSTVPLAACPVFQPGLDASQPGVLGRLLSRECRKGCLSPEYLPSPVQARIRPHWCSVLWSSDLGTSCDPGCPSCPPLASGKVSPTPTPPPTLPPANVCSGEPTGMLSTNTISIRLTEVRSRCGGPVPSCRRMDGGTCEQCPLWFPFSAIGPHELTRNRRYPCRKHRTGCLGHSADPHPQSFHPPGPEAVGTPAPRLF